MNDEIAKCLADNLLHLVLLPTEACNFRCTYCYEDFRHSQMQPSVVTGVKRFLDRRAPHLDRLELSWFGGEPLIARRVLEDISLHISGILRRHPRIRYHSDMTTNGWLLSKERFEELLVWGVTQYQVSFDGPRELHDRKRVRVNGQGTFDRIWENLRAISSVPGEFRMIVRVHVDKENHRLMKRFIDDFAEAFGSDHRYELFVRLLSRLGGPNDGSLPVFEEQPGDEAVTGLAEYAKRRGIAVITTRTHRPVCYAARANSWVVRADGRLNKCTVALEHTNNQVGRILKSGLIDVDQTRYNGWLRGLRSGDREELRCPMVDYADPPLSNSSDVVTLTDPASQQ